VATLLARGKLAALEDGYERTGFGDFDEGDEGTFEADGHPEVRWEVEVKKPTVEIGADRILAMLTGGDAEAGGSTDLSAVLGQKASQGGGADDSGTGALPSAEALSGLLQTQLNQIGEQIRKGVRQVRLTVSWRDGARTESFSVVTHLVVLQAKEST
jgi:general secretion pathway protein I